MHLKVVWRKIVSSTEGKRRGRACDACGGGGKTPLINEGGFGIFPENFFNFEHLHHVRLMFSLSN